MCTFVNTAEQWLFADATGWSFAGAFSAAFVYRVIVNNLQSPRQVWIRCSTRNWDVMLEAQFCRNNGKAGRPRRYQENDRYCLCQVFRIISILLMARHHRMQTLSQRTSEIEKSDCSNNCSYLILTLPKIPLSLSPWLSQYMCTCDFFLFHTFSFYL